MNEPGNWLSNISRATWTLLLAAVALCIAWQVIQRLLPALVTIGALLAIYRTVLAGRRHSGW